MLLKPQCIFTCPGLLLNIYVLIQQVLGEMQICVSNKLPYKASAAGPHALEVHLQNMFMTFSSLVPPSPGMLPIYTYGKHHIEGGDRGKVTTFFF